MEGLKHDLRTGSRVLAAVCTALLLACVCCPAQDLGYVKYLRQQAWSNEEGLPQSSVHAVAQTADGYLWAATEGGLARFDGERFAVFDRANEVAFKSDDLCCLQVAGETLWVGTADGLVRMQKGSFRRFGVDDGLPSAVVTAMMTADDGDLEVQTENGWVRWRHNRFERLSSAPVEAGFIAGTGTEQWRFTAQRVTVAAGVFGTLTGGAEDRAWTTGRELPVGRVQTVFVDREGAAWVGMNGGLYVLRADSAVATEVSGMRGSSVLSVFEDAEGNHWVGTETSGLHVLRRLEFRDEPGLSGLAVTSVAQTRDGAMWVGTREDGLRRVKDGVVDAPVAASKLTSSVILCMAPGSQGGLWVGTPDGLNFVGEDAAGGVRPVQQITAADGLPDDSVRSLATDGQGGLWVGTRQGLVHLWEAAAAVGMKTLTAADGLGGDMIGTLLVTQGEAAGGGAAKTPKGLWAGTSGGLSLVGADGKIVTFTTKDGLGAEIVTAMAQDADGDLWVGTSGGGLSLFRDGRFVSVPGFPMPGRGGNIEGITADGRGFLWFRMDRGIRRVAQKTLLTCVQRGRCDEGNGWGPVGAVYGVADGLPNEEVVAGGSSAGWLASDGGIWFPTRGGVAIANTERVTLNKLPPPLVLERFLVDETPEDLNAHRIAIPYGRARYTVEYAGLNFTTPSEVRYRFRLEGFDKGWTDAGAKRSATYTNLPPGSYRFRVEAMNADGARGQAAAELSFKIVPPIYRRWWFVALAALALAGLLAGLYLLRLRSLRGRFDAVLAERNRMAREIHDTLTQDFVGTSLQLDLIAQHLNRGKVEMAAAQVKRTRQMVTEGLDEARRSIWELRANNAGDSLPTRLTKVVEREQFAGLKPKLHLGGAYREVESRVERELLRIAQEALTNVLHHAQATEVTVDLHYSTDTVMLTIEDNGVGFAVDDGLGKAGHYGLLGMKERSALIGGTLEITSERGKGTKVTLRVETARSAG
jgi:signal transduction histidine kinase/ligand-binding sensor domain-containing protein